MSTLVDFSTGPLVSTFVDVSTERIKVEIYFRYDIASISICRHNTNCKLELVQAEEINFVIIQGCQQT